MAAQSASCDAGVTSSRFVSHSRENFFDPLLQLREMRSRPVDLFAIGTAAELIIVNFGKRLELVEYFGLACRFQQRVTPQAAGKRFDGVGEFKTPDNLDRLFVGVLGTWIISMLHDRVHKEAPIAR